MLEKIRNEKWIAVLITLLLTAVYFCMEPLLTQVYAIRAFGIIYYPYCVIRSVATILPFAFYIFYLIKNGSNSMTACLIPIGVLMAAYLIPTLLSGENVNVWVEAFFPLSAYYILIMPICRDRQVLKNFVRGVSWLYLVLAGLNLLFLLRPEFFERFGEWTSESFISTIENLAGFPLVMGLCFQFLDLHYGGSRVKFFLYFAVYLVSNYLMWTAAQVVGAMIMILYLIPPVQKLLDKVSLGIWAAIGFGLFVLFVWFWEPIMNLAPVHFLIDEVLKKDVTFTGRLEIWQGVLDLCRDKLLLGHGLMDNPQYLYFDTGFNNDWVHAHNAFLQTLYEGGILTLCCVAAVMLFTAKKIRNPRDVHETGIIKIIILVFLLNLEMDQFFIYPWRSCLWCMICFLCNFAVAVNGYDN